MESEMNSYIFLGDISYQDLNLYCVYLRDGEFIKMPLAYSSAITVTVPWSLK